MKKLNLFNIRLGLACNSSSSHSILILKNPSQQNTDEYSEFGWNFFTANNQESKNNYFYALLKENISDLIPSNEQDEFFNNFFGQNSLNLIDKSSYIDHQSVITFPLDFNGKLNMDFLNEFYHFIMSDNVVIAGGNDNTEQEHHLSSSPDLISSFNILPLENTPSDWVIRKDYNLNFWTLFNKDSGSKLRFSFDPNQQSPTKASSPELVDIKITDYCPFDCDFCYQNSTTEGQHASMEYIQYISNELKKAQVFEVACLAEGTMILTNTGYKKIENLNIGESVFSSDGTIKKIKKITPSEKECINLIGNKGFDVICTPDHPFISNNVIVEAQHLLGKSLDQLNKIIIDSPTLLNISQFIIKKNEHPNSRSGIINRDMYKYCSSSIYVPNEISLSKELMFFYGIVVAEGSKKAITLHSNEIDIAKRVGDFYSSLSKGLKYKVYKYPSKNSINVEFSTPSFFESIFFKAMNCGYGSHNKNLSFLYSLNDKELIREALYGLFIGDGSFRNKKNGKYIDFSLSFKTVSKTLAMDLITLMKIHFDVNSSFYEGISPNRKIEGRTLKSSIYFMVEVYGKSNIDKIFPFIFEDNEYYKKIGPNLKNTDIKIKSIIPVGVKKVFDITLEDDSTHIFSISHGVLTHNCGGGEPTLHPNFTNIIKSFKENNIVFNFTTKNFSIFKHKDIDYILDNVGAIAFSVQSIQEIKKLHSFLLDCNHEKASLHDYQSSINVQYVMGSSSIQEFKNILYYVKDLNINITLLGFKEYGRGNSFIPQDYSNWLDVVREVKQDSFMKISIDTALASQYKSELLEFDKESQTFHTSEGSFSLYIDAVSKKMYPSSYSSNVQEYDFDEHWIENYAFIGIEAPNKKPKKSFSISK